MNEPTPPTTEPTIEFHELVDKHARKCLAAIGQEYMRGPSGWKFGREPQDLIRDAIMNALIEGGVANG